jgi:hypothetical protein
MLLQTTAEPGSFSATLSRANLALARALRAQGKHDEARSAARADAEQLSKTLAPEHADTRTARQLADSDRQAQ